MIGIVLVAGGDDGGSSSDPIDLDTKPEVGIPEGPPPDGDVIKLTIPPDLAYGDRERRRASARTRPSSSWSAWWR